MQFESMMVYVREVVLNRKPSLETAIFMLMIEGSILPFWNNCLKSHLISAKLISVAFTIAFIDDREFEKPGI